MHELWQSLGTNHNVLYILLIDPARNYGHTQNEMINLERIRVYKSLYLSQINLFISQIKINCLLQHHTLIGKSCLNWSLRGAVF